MRADEEMSPAAGRAAAGRPYVKRQDVDRTAVRDLLDRFDAELAARDRSRHTRRSYRRAVRAFLAEVGSTDPEQLRETGPTAYLHLLRERGAAPNTLNLQGSALRAFYRLVLQRPKVPLPASGAPARAHIGPLLTPERFEAGVRALASRRDRALLSLVYWAGLKLGEVSGIRRRDVPDSPGHFPLRSRAEDEEPYLPRAGLVHVQAYLRTRKVGGPWLFPGSHPTKALSTRRMQEIVRGSAHAFGLQSLTMDALRDSCAVRLLRQGTKIQVVARFMGYRNVRNLESHLEAV